MQTLFDNIADRINMHDSIQLTIDSMNTYGPLHKHWAIAWSGGKDSTATLTLIIYLIDSGKIQKPDSLHIFYADTRMELTPLAMSAADMIDDLRERGYNVHVVMAPMEKRFLPYILGRGVPPPNNNTLRWCTRQIKIDPMQKAVNDLYHELGEQFLMITGVRIGESAIRDRRIILSCSKDGAECGQGWYQTSLSDDHCAKLSPLLHWRVCHVWEWLKHGAPTAEFGDWSTTLLADAYGGDEAQEINARTGCIGCPLAAKDTALDTILKNPRYRYLAPLKKLREVYEWLRKPEIRLRKDGTQRNKNGAIPKNPQRLGPITIPARQEALARILDIQAEVNTGAHILKMPFVDIINAEEVEFIKKCHEQNLFPDGWDGDEITGDVMIDKMYADGTVQPNMFL